MTELTPSPRPSTRVGLFVDEPNMHVSLRELGIAFDAVDLYKRAQTLGRVVIARAYLSMKSEEQGTAAATRAGATGSGGALVSGGSLSASDWLARKYNEAGYTVRMVPPAFRHKDVDTALAVDAAQAVMEDRIDLVIIASGDADYVPVADLAHSMGKSVGIAAVDRNCSPSLRAREDLFLPIPSPSMVVNAPRPEGR